MKVPIIPTPEILSDFSKEINCHVLGDCSGRSVTENTTEGFNLVTDENVVDLGDYPAHALMIGVGIPLVLLLSSSKGNKINIVIIMLFFLVIIAVLYSAGRKNLENQSFSQFN